MLNIRRAGYTALALTTLVLSACTAPGIPEQWVPPPDGDARQRMVDSADCDGFARSNAKDVTAFGPPIFVIGAAIGNAIGNSTRYQADYADCMMARGYTPAVPVQPALIAPSAAATPQGPSDQ